MYIYPNDLKAKPTLWLWTLRDVAVIGVCLVLSVLALVELHLIPPLIATVLFASSASGWRGPVSWISCAAPCAFYFSNNNISNGGPKK